MTKKYDHLFVRDMPVIAEGEMDSDATGDDIPANLGEGFWLVHERLFPESQVNMSHVWIGETDQPSHWVDPHVHDYDEVLIWTGSDPENPRDLGAEIYLDIEGERHVITTSGSVYIPAGVIHCPLGWNRVDRPFRFSALSLSPSYRSHG